MNNKIVCNCTHDGKGNSQGADFQNERYGKNVRIATEKLKMQGREQEYTCTVCGKMTTRAIK